MGAFILHRSDGSDRTRRVLLAARGHFERVGFTGIVAIQFGVYEGLVCGSLSGNAAAIYSAVDGQAMVVGTFFHGGRFGAAALMDLVRRTTPYARPGSAGTAGHYSVALAKQGAAWLFGDELGMFQFYHDATLRVLSSSLQAVLFAVDRPTLSVQAAYEYVHHGNVLGDETAVNEVRMLAPGAMVRLSDPPAIIPRPPIALPDIEPGDLETHADRCLAAMRVLIGGAVAAFGDNIQAPLSGGYDSRLLLALLQEQGAQPHVYVYGRPGDADVRVAQAIASGEGFPLEHAEKRLDPGVTPDMYPAIAEANFLHHDAPAYFGFFDTGEGRRDRDARSFGGALAVSGGGGEVFRKVFLSARHEFYGSRPAVVLLFPIRPGDLYRPVRQPDLLRGHGGKSPGNPRIGCRSPDTRHHRTSLPVVPLSCRVRLREQRHEPPWLVVLPVHRAVVG